MSYANVEAAVVTVIRTHADFDSTNCIAGDRSPIKKGLERVCTVKYGNVRREAITITMMRHIWIVLVDIFVPYRGRIQDMETSLATERQKVIDTLAIYPHLDDLAGVTKAEILNGDAPEPLNPKKSAYRGQRLYLEVHETTKPVRVG
jgi:hypothetical protein